MRKPTDLTPKRPGEKRTIAVALLSRMIITPALLLPLRYFWSVATHNVADDPCFIVRSPVRVSARALTSWQVAFALLCGSPPAITLAQVRARALVRRLAAQTRAAYRGGRRRL
jgi:predicted permease